eukprot:Nk52_evm8s628 gene=Nk52_evmTU8s628
MSENETNQEMVRRLGSSNSVITSFHNGVHDSEEIPSQWIFPKKAQKPRGPFALPLSAYLILGIETMERFSFWSACVLVFQYCTDMLGFESATATSISMGINFWSLSCSAFFAYMADTYWGKGKTITISVVFYLLALGCLAVTSTPMAFSNFEEKPQPHLALYGFIVFFALIGLGAGGIKPTVAPFVAEQVFKVESAEEIQRIFSYIYWVINFGSMAGLASAPYLTHFSTYKADNGETKGSSYYVPFSISCGVFLLAFIMYLSGWRLYTHRLPQGSIFTDFYRIVRSAIRNKNLSFAEASEIRTAESRGESAETNKAIKASIYSAHANSSDDQLDLVSELPLTDSKKMPEGQIYDAENNNYNVSEDFINKMTTEADQDTDDKKNKVVEFDFDHEKHWLYKATGYSYSQIKAVRQIFRMVPFFFYFSYFYMMLGSFYVFVQMADWMVKPSWIQNTTLTLVEPLCVLICIPIHTYFIYPFLRNKCGLKLTYITRMLVGFFFSVLYFLSATMIQYWITQQGTIDDDGNFTGTGEHKGATHSTISIWWILLCEVLAALSEVWAKVSFFEFCYSQAPKSMVAAVMTLYTLSDAGGSLLGIAGHEMFVPKRYVYTFAGMAGGMLFIIMPLFYWHMGNYNTEGVYGGPTADIKKTGPAMYFSNTSSNGVSREQSTTNNKQ